MVLGSCLVLRLFLVSKAVLGLGSVLVCSVALGLVLFTGLEIYLGLKGCFEFPGC